MINHPLVHEFYIPGNNGRYNKSLKLKRKQIEEYVLSVSGTRSFCSATLSVPTSLSG
jgi:hypothetical protein